MVLPAVAFLELAAVFVEAYVYHLLCDLPFVKSLGISALLNAVSFLAGIGLNAALGWTL